MRCIGCSWEPAGAVSQTRTRGRELKGKRLKRHKNNLWIPCDARYFNAKCYCVVHKSYQTRGILPWSVSDTYIARRFLAPHNRCITIPDTSGTCHLYNKFLIFWTHVMLLGPLFNTIEIFLWHAPHILINEFSLLNLKTWPLLISFINNAIKDGKETCCAMMFD